jgi:hypothetical protein
MAAIGAEQKQVILLKDFRSSLKNAHSRYGDQTARFAP